MCNANMDGRDIICIMPTGQWRFFISQLDSYRLIGWMGSSLFRSWEVAHVPATGDADAWVHVGDLASCIAHEGSVTAFAREPKSVKEIKKPIFCCSTDDVDIVEGLMFTASMSAKEMTEAYNRLTATASGKGKDSARKEVKICYVTVCSHPCNNPFRSIDVQVA